MISGVRPTLSAAAYNNLHTGNFVGGQLELQELLEARRRERHGAWDGNQDDGYNAASPSCGEKRSHSHVTSAGPLRKPVKVHATTGSKPKAGDYEVAVQNIIAEAICHYRGYLSTETPYPGPMEEMRWAKKSWKDGCDECDIQMAFNSEIIKLVSDPFNQCAVLTVLEDHEPQLALSWPDQNQSSATR
jgi:hypothetical protein